MYISYNHNHNHIIIIIGSYDNKGNNNTLRQIRCHVSATTALVRSLFRGYVVRHRQH